MYSERLFRYALVILSMVCFRVEAFPAGFDCRKAQTEVENLICSNSRLSYLDEQMTLDYKRALAKHGHKDELARNQKEWIRSERDSCHSVSCIEAAYVSRIRSLTEENSGVDSTSSPREKQADEGFSWLKFYKGKTTNEVCWDDRFAKFLKNISPSVKLRLSDDNWPLVETLQEFLCGPPHDVKVSENRYVILAGCRAHSCSEKAWIWIDTEEGIVIGALIHSFFGTQQAGESPFLLVFLTSVDSSAIPGSAWKELDTWLLSKELKGDIRRFVGSDGKVVDLRP
jgi:uncharacterized protein YecT (DUF1311 family)